MRRLGLVVATQSTSVEGQVDNGAMHSRTLQRAVPLFAALLACLAGCGRKEPAIQYKCEARGERFHYREGSRIAPAGIDVVQFSLQTSGAGYEISADPPLPEIADREVLRDATRSSDAESVYLRDWTDANSRQRTVASLVINTVSGDVRLFYHRWLPPDGWRDSDQFLYLGTCRKVGGGGAVG